MANESSLNAIDDERVREHLANERTFLAWLRTGVSTMGMGVVIAKLRYSGGSAASEAVELTWASNVGLVFALVGIVIIVFSVFFFLAAREQIRKRNYRSTIVLSLTLAGLITVLGLMVLWYLSLPLFSAR